jgi:fimbrial chaperone protein
MKHRYLPFSAVTVAGLLLSSVATAGSLEVSPISIEVTAPAQATVVRVRNLAKAPIVTQLRVFRWHQVDGVDRLEPSTDVVVSPPMATLAAGAEQTVRLIRTGGARSQGEDAYRLVVDELPQAPTLRSGSVAVVVRHSLPVFFRPPGEDRASLSWKFETRNGRDALVAHNAGLRRMRIAALSLRDEGGQTVQVAPGLAGYVLSGSTMRFELPVASRKLARKSLTIQAQGDVGQINVVLPKIGN